MTRRVVFVAKSIKCRHCDGTGKDGAGHTCAFCFGEGRYAMARTAEDFGDDDKDIFVEPDRREQSNGKA